MVKKIAVIILNYFGTVDTLDCVNSVFLELEAKIFLVDNSNNHSEAKKLKMLFIKNDNIELLFPEENLGFAGGVNFALRQALREGFNRFLLLNNDAVLKPSTGQFLLSAWESHPGSLMSPIINWDGNSLSGRYYHCYLGLIASKPYGGYGWIFYLTGCVMLFDEQLINKVGCFDEQFFMYGEDIEYCCRALAHGAKVLSLPRQLVRHAGSKSAIQGSFFYEYHIARGHFLLTFKIFDDPYRIILSLLGKSLSLSLRALVRSLRYLSLIPLFALIVAPFPLKVRVKK